MSFAKIPLFPRRFLGGPSSCEAGCRARGAVDLGGGAQSCCVRAARATAAGRDSAGAASRELGPPDFKLRRTRNLLAPVFASMLVSALALAADVVVALDGSGDYTSLQEAISAAPMNTDTRAPRWEIRVKPGTYRERIYVQRERGHIRVIGDDVATTTVAFDLHAQLPGPDGKPIGTFRTPTVQIDGDGMIWENITFANTAGPVAQALALRADGDRLEFRRCRFLGWQDTILLNRGRHYFEDCYVEGHVDFIFGAATAWFERCRIHALRDGYLTAASTPQGQAHGFVFAHCRITAAEGVHTYLGRPWREFARTVFLHTEMSAAVRPEGWHNWNKPPAERTTFYAEFGSTGPGAAPTARVPWAHALTAEQAAALTPARVLGGGDGWNPVGANPVAPWMPDQGDGTFRNPVIDADYSDPDAVRVGDDFWMTSSSFGHVPGLPILHSRDLVNWTLVAHALPRLVPEEVFATPQHGRGVWAPALRFHAGKFWLYYPDPDFGISLVTATDPRGPWSAPVLVAPGRGLIDPCPLWDDDGKVYLIHAWAKSRAGFNNVLTLLRLDASGTRVEEDLGVAIDGNQFPNYSTLEGPKFHRRNGWYYVFAPAGGVKTGWQSVFRAKNVRGPYEARIVLDQGDTLINGPHQGALVDTPAGEEWFLHFQDKDAYGRVVHLQPVRWRDDWPVIGDDADGDGRGQPVLTARKPALPARALAAPAATDEFEGTAPGRQWQWQANPGAEWARVQGGALQLAAQSPASPNLWAAPHLLLQKFPAEAFTATVRLRVADETRAGLVVFGSDYAWIGLERRAGETRLVWKRCRTADRGGVEEELAAVPMATADVTLRVSVAPGGRCRFSSGSEDGRFAELAGDFVAQPGRWVGAKVGLFAERLGEGPSPGATCDWFRIEGNPPGGRPDRVSPLKKPAGSAKISLPGAG